MKHINDTFHRLVLLLLFAALASLTVAKSEACEIGQALNMDTKKCEDINTTLNLKWVEWYNWNDEE
jgi:hypothetical protein